jgi:hypothetical protein
MRRRRPTEYLRATLSTALALGIAQGCGEDLVGPPTEAGVTGGASNSTDPSGGDGVTPTSGAGSTPGQPSTDTDGTTAVDGETTGTSGSTGEGGHWVPPPPVVVPPLPEPPDYSDYPVDEIGRPIVAAGPLVNWVVVTTPDAITARKGCADLVANCHEPGVRSIDACMLSAPACATDEPWNEASPCCAEACFADYSALRVQGTDPLTAYLTVLYERPICMPGVDGMLGGAP